MEKRMSKRNCPICGNNCDNIVLWKAREVLHETINLPDEITVVTCSVCGCCYSDTPATMEQYDAYYEKNNIYAGRSPKKAPKLAEELFLLIDRLFNKDDILLDMGSGGGYTLHELQVKGYNNLYGMDVAKENVSIIEKMGIKADVAGVYTPIKEEYKALFDGVLLNAVLEHLLFPRWAINNMGNYLKENGKIIIVVPDMKLVGDGGMDTSHHFHHEHINYFSIMSLDRLLHSEGFSRIYYKTIVEQNDLERLMIAVYEKQQQQQDENIIDTVSASAITEYIRAQKDKKLIIEQKLEEIKDKPIILWGIGARMMQTIAATELKNMHIEMCIDGNPARWNQNYYIVGKKYLIESPDGIEKKINNKSVIIICCNSKQYELEMKDIILAKGLQNEIIVL